MKNYYHILNLPNFVEAQEVERAYGLFVKQRYDIPNFYEVWDAYSVLSDPASKLSYDIALRLWLQENPEEAEVQESNPMFLPVVVASPAKKVSPNASGAIFDLFRFMLIGFCVLVYLHNAGGDTNRYYVPAQVGANPVNITYAEQPAPATLYGREAAIFPPANKLGVDTGGSPVKVAKCVFSR